DMIVCNSRSLRADNGSPVAINASISSVICRAFGFGCATRASCTAPSARFQSSLATCQVANSMKASDLVAGEVWISVLALESTSRALDVYPNQSRSRARLTSLATCGTADWGVDFVDCGADTVWPEERARRP